MLEKRRVVTGRRLAIASHSCALDFGRQRHSSSYLHEADKQQSRVRLGPGESFS